MKRRGIMKEASKQASKQDLSLPNFSHQAEHDADFIGASRPVFYGRDAPFACKK